MIADLVLLLIFLVFILSGYRKGLILSLCTLLVLVLSCLGGAAAQKALTPTVSEWLEPKLTAYLSEQLQEQVSESAGQLTEESGLTINGKTVSLAGIAQLLESLGIDAERVTQDAATTVTSPVTELAAQAVSQMLVEAIAGTLIFLVAFLVLCLIFHSIGLILNVVDRLPVVHTLNHVGGGLIGLISGAFFLTMAMALLVGTGALPEDTFQGPISRLLRLPRSIQFRSAWV